MRAPARFRNVFQRRSNPRCPLLRFEIFEIQEIALAA